MKFEMEHAREATSTQQTSTVMISKTKSKTGDLSNGFNGCWKENGESTEFI